jgi:hypothetical protein
VVPLSLCYQYQRLTSRNPELSWDTSPDLSIAKKLREVEFCAEDFTTAWVTMTLKTISSEHRDLRRVSIYCFGFPGLGDRGANARVIVGDALYGHWMDLDRTLIQLWESLAVRAKLSYYSTGKGKRARKFVECLLPETTKRGMIKLVDLTNRCGRH